MRSALVVLALLPLASAACKRDEPAPPAPVVIGTGGGALAVPVPATPATASVSPSPTASAAPDAGPVDAGSADAGVDTSKWETRDINTLGTAHFAFDGTVMFPKGTKTRASATTVSGGGAAGTFAFLDLPDRTEVMLDERSAKSAKDGAFVKQLIGEMSGGKLIFDRSDANGFFFAHRTPDGGVLVQGASWAVSPGLGCATQKPITKDKIAVVDAICASLRPKTKK
jgi:hypothetical protein